jgi:preprotein translocase subunit SecD
VARRRARIQVEGLREVRRALNKVSDDSKNEMRSTHLDAAQVVERQAKYEVPIRTGRLRGSIRAAATKTRGNVKAGGYGIKYAGPIHFGVPRTRGRPANIRPQPFIYEAADKRLDEVMDVYERRIGELIRRYGLGD